MNADLHNLNDLPPEPWGEPWQDDYDCDELDPDEIALERAESELDQIERWVDVAEQHDHTDR